MIKATVKADAIIDAILASDPDSVVIDGTYYPVEHIEKCDPDSLRLRVRVGGLRLGNENLKVLYSMTAEPVTITFQVDDLELDHDPLDLTRIAREKGLIK